jgi:uncharacterized protein
LRQIYEKNEKVIKMAKQNRLKKIDRQKIDKYLRVLKNEGIKVSQAILFGSYAKGRAKAESDMDIAIISTQFGKNSFREMMLLRRLALRVDSYIEPIPLTPEDMEDRYSTLVQEIKKGGQELRR